MIEIIAITLIIFHFGIPIIYYYYATRKWLPRSWNLNFKIYDDYSPRISIILPTYNEASLIHYKLENIKNQDYPIANFEIIIVDSASNDGTLIKAKEWYKKHKNIKMKFIYEPVRKGKARALNTALKYATGDYIIITDVDSYWTSNDTLKKVAKWLSDQQVGAVSCIKEPNFSGPVNVEKEYRDYYNNLRVAESKAWSTPIFHGELAAFKRELLNNIGGFPEDIGADDSFTASILALNGYRSIVTDDIKCRELLPSSNYNLWKIRRAQHLLQHFVNTIKIIKNSGKGLPIFKKIIYIEAYLHVINPWLLVMGAILLMISSVGSIISRIFFLLALVFLVNKPYRAWMFNQLYLIFAFFNNFRSKEIIWEKQEKRFND